MIKLITTKFVTSWRGKASIICLISLLISTTAFSQWTIPLGQRDPNSVETLISNSLLFLGLAFLFSGVHVVVTDSLEEKAHAKRNL